MYKWLLLLIVLVVDVGCVKQPTFQQTQLAAATSTPTDQPTETISTPTISSSGTLTPLAAPGISAPPPGSPIELIEIKMFDSGAGWGWGIHHNSGQCPSLGDPWWLLHTVDGGNTWYVMTPAGANPCGRSAYYFLDAMHAWVSYYGDYRTSSGKTTLWKTEDAKTWAIQGDCSTACGHAGSEMQFADNQHGWIWTIGVGAGNVFVGLYKTVDGGANWETVFDPDCNDCAFANSEPSLSFVDNQIGWAITSPHMNPGPPMLFHSVDGGLTWTSQDVPSPDQRAGFYQTHFCNADNLNQPREISVFDSQTVAFILACKGDLQGAQPFYGFVTVNGGKSWQIAAIPSRPEEFLMTDAQWINQDVGWVLLHGANATAIGLYHTTNRGQTWSRLSIPDSGAQLDFVTDKLGWMIGDDRFKLYMTPDGGQNWTGLLPHIGP